jgi:hypothetical protein
MGKLDEDKDVLWAGFDDDGNPNDIETGPKFGCIHHEPKC